MILSWLQLFLRLYFAVWNGASDHSLSKCFHNWYQVIRKVPQTGLLGPVSSELEVKWECGMKLVYTKKKRVQNYYCYLNSCSQESHPQFWIWLTCAPSLLLRFFINDILQNFWTDTHIHESITNFIHIIATLNFGDETGVRGQSRTQRQGDFPDNFTIYCTICCVA